MSDVHENILVYYLENPSIWAKNDRLIRDVIIKAAYENDFRKNLADVSFGINPISGWIDFSLPSQIFSEQQKKNLLFPPPEITKRAKDFLDNVITKCEEAGFKDKGIPILLPKSIYGSVEFIETVLVPHHDKPFLDHWLVRFFIKLRLFKDRTEKASVLYSSIDVRIGANKQIIGFSSHWRPSFLNFIETPLIHEENSLNQDHDSDEKVDVSTLCYQLFGEHALQNFITPYFSHSDGDHSDLVPASVYSLKVGIEPDYSEKSKVICRTLIVGGSGKYLFKWTAWEPEKIWDEGIQELEEISFQEKISGKLQDRSQIELPTGTYNLSLIVIDTETGVIFKQKQMIFSSPVLKQAQSHPILA